jgi:hypothetical protein
MNRNPGNQGPEPDEDFPELPDEAWSRAMRGKHTAAVLAHTNVVVIDEDLREFFPTEKAVNDALRSLAKAMGRYNAEGVRPESGFSLEERQRAHDYERPFRTVAVHSDLEAIFPNSKAVNTALRACVEILHQVEARRAS